MGRKYKNKKVFPGPLVSEITTIVSSALKHCLRLKWALTDGLLVSMTQKHRLQSITILGPGRNREWRELKRGHRIITSKLVIGSLSCFHMCIHVYLFNTYLLRACSHPGTVLNIESMILSKDPQKSCLHKVYSLLGKADKLQNVEEKIIKHRSCYKERHPMSWG